MVLSDGEFWDAIGAHDFGIDPIPEKFEPSSVDLRLDSTILGQRSVPVHGMDLDPSTLDVSEYLKNDTTQKDASQQPYILKPGILVIANTIERIRPSNKLAARVEGRSRLARLGIAVHLTEPKIDLGYDNQITLKIPNFGPYNIKLQCGMKICTLIVERLR